MFKRIFLILFGALQSRVLKLIFVYRAFSYTYKNYFYFFFFFFPPKLFSGNLGFLGRQNDLSLEPANIYIYVKWK